MESKKKKGSFGKTIAIVLLFIVFIALAFILGQYASSKMDYNIFKAKGNDVAKENKKSDDSEKLPEKSKEHIFIKSITRKIYLNNNEHTLMVYYYSDSLDKKTVDEFVSNSSSDASKYNNYKALYEEVYLDNNKILSMNEFDYSKNDDEINNIINDDIDEIYSYIKKFKDTNGNAEYMLLEYTISSLVFYLNEADYRTGNAILVSEEGKVLDTYTKKVGSGLSIKVSLNEAKQLTDRVFTTISSSGAYIYGVQYDVKNNYMYYIDESDCTKDNIDEYKITVTNGVVSKELNKTYSENQLERTGGC